VESGIKGGALITADIAASYNRDVFAVPGRPGDQWSAGCNSLIKNNKAALVENPEDIEYFLNWQSSALKVPVQRTLFNELSDSEKIIFENLNKIGEMNIDHLCRVVDIPVYKLSALLLQMEFNGIIKCYPGNLYRIVS
jgi:DNA processing protein